MARRTVPLPKDDPDIIVAGSGGAALAGALRAARGGARVLLLEATDCLGGTTAMSGAGTWIPANARARAAGIADDADRALAYIRAASPDGWQGSEDPLWQAFVAEAPRMIDFLERHSALRFALADDPDPWPAAPGALPRGRMLSPRPLRARVPGFRLQPAHVPHVLTYQELKSRDPWHHPLRTIAALAPRLAWRLATGRRAQGSALIAGLARAALAAGVEIRTGWRVTGLDRAAGGAVRGVFAEGPDGGRRRIGAAAGVLLATGGFERDLSRRSRHFAGPVDLVASSPGNLGCAARIAEEIGAELAHMSEANVAPALPARLRGRALPIGTFHHREPGAILVGPDGRRFVDEWAFNLGEVLLERRGDGAAAHLPCWLVGDAAALSGAPMLRWFLRAAPGWAREASDATRLGATLALPPGALEATLADWNAGAAQGRDPRFGRHLDPWSGPDPRRLRPLAGALWALPFNLVFLSTKGGPRTDARARVLDRDGRAIPGLCCAGVAMANPFGTRAMGAGTTIGPNLTWGWIAGATLLDRLATPPADVAKETAA
ncbi:FAD-dependent oxidoreductase [Frigidibacter sp. MR17.24]|uniref:FAD-dependent oxidoreductase n=1 Tax=Frigidibacter sp. MR17.24 TaxID=3127345 RepID=UPI003012AB6F